MGRIIFSDCVPFISENKCQFFDYGADFTELQDTLQRLSNYVQMLSISKYCEEVVISYMCNYVYPGCNTSREVPVGICTEECSKFVTQGECMETFEKLESATTLVDMFHIDITCQNGSQSSKFLNYTTDPFECFNISGECIYALLSMHSCKHACTYYTHFCMQEASELLLKLYPKRTVYHLNGSSP